MLKRHPVISFYILIFALALFGTWLAFFVFHGSLWVQWIVALSPGLAALVLTALLDGKAGVDGLLKRLVRWRVHWTWYLAVFLLPVLFSLGWVFFNTLLEGQGLAAAWGSLVLLFQAFLRGMPALLALTPFFALLIVGEELGWRGFALERLLKTHGPILSSLIVGFFWGIWHIPAALDPSYVLNKAPLPYSITLFTLGTIVFSFVYTWLWQNTIGSLLIVCLFHSFFNIFGYVTAALFPSFYIRFWLYLLVVAVIMLPVWAFFPAGFASKEGAHRAGTRFTPG